jgi:DNA-binding CsgD family transcriptional regulator
VGAATDRDDVLLDLIGECYGLLDLERFSPGLLEALRRALPSDWVSLNSLSEDPLDAAAISHPPVMRPELYDVYARHAHEHPVARYMQRTGDGGPIRVSDVVDQETFRGLTLYRELYAVLGVEYQVAFTLPAPAGHQLAIAMSRSDRDYTDAECALLRRARPHLIQAYRNAREHTELKRRLAQAPALPGRDLRAFGLTPREAEVVRRVATGRQNGDIATELGVSERTVQKHLQRAYRKLGVSSRSEAAKVAWRLDADHERTGSAARPPYTRS